MDCCWNVNMNKLEKVQSTKIIIEFFGHVNFQRCHSKRLLRQESPSKAHGLQSDSKYDLTFCMESQ